MQPVSLYIIGAQCTGKTTLLHALQEAFAAHHPTLHIRTITEVARTVLQEHQFTRDDIAHNPQRALQLQQLILAAQYAEENKCSTDAVLSDRSGIDPIVYATNYGPPLSRALLEDSSQWKYLRDRMRKALVILCPPHQEWLKDDGVRLMARSWEEWEKTHATFIGVLEKNGIPFRVVPREVMDIEQRVEVVLSLWCEMVEGNTLPVDGEQGTGQGQGDYTRSVL